MRFLALLVACVLTGSTSHRPNQSFDTTRYYSVKYWRLIGEWTYQESKQEVRGDKVRTYTADVGARIELKLEQTKAHSSRRYRWRAVDGPPASSNVSGKITDLTRDRNTWSKMEFTIGAGRLEDPEGRLDIETDGSVRVVCGGMSTLADYVATNSQGGHMKTESPVAFTSGMFDCEGQGKGMTITGSSDGIASFPLWEGTLPRFKWTVIPWEENPEHEPTMDISDRAWRPKPDETVKVSLKWEGKAEKVRVYLENISVEPGKCMNDEPGAKEEEDLEVPQAALWAIGKEGSGASAKYTCVKVLPKQDPPQQVDLEVKAKDYGAWGSVHAEVLLDGKWRDAKMDGKTTMQIPYDSDEDHIADQWEKDNGVLADGGDADEDNTPVGNGTKGDGLTNYEEYRGFEEEGSHFTTDPKIKDLFICDETKNATGVGGDNSLATEGIALFEKASELKVHSKLTKKEMSDGRIVNRNHKEGAHKVDQHGIFIRRGPAGSDAISVAAGENHAVGPPVRTAYVSLPVGNRYRRESGWSGNSKTENDIEDRISTVAHELGHCVGISHHGEALKYVLWRWKKDAAGLYFLEETEYEDGEFKKATNAGKRIRAFFEKDGIEVTYGGAPPGVFGDDIQAFRVLLGMKNGQHSGTENCFMRYPDGNAYISEKDASIRFIPDGSQWVKRDSLCTAKKGTGINASSHSPQSRYGDGVLGNCKKQIVVNDSGG